MSLFEYALLRVVPRVERGEFINAGVVLYCQDAKFLDARIRLDPERLRAGCAKAELRPAPWGCCLRASASDGSSRPAAPWCNLLQCIRASLMTPRRP
jgi:hypothetical protein